MAAYKADTPWRSNLLHVKPRPACDIAPRNTDAAHSDKLVKHLVAGGAAGLCEATICHPLDTIKTRMQMRHRHIGQLDGPFKAASFIVRREGVLALYKGLTAVVSGITPKMAMP